MEILKISNFNTICKNMIVTLLVLIGIFTLGTSSVQAESLVWSGFVDSDHQMLNLPDGKIVVVFKVRGSNEIYQQLYGTDNKKIGGAVLIGTGDIGRDVPQLMTTITGNANVTYVVTWNDVNGYIRYQRFRSTGAKYGSAVNVALASASSYSSVVPLSGGGWMIFYLNASADPVRQIYTAAGAKSGGVIPTPGNHPVTSSTRFFTLSTGEHIALWHEAGTWPNTLLKFQRYTIDGDAVGSIVTVRNAISSHGGWMDNTYFDLQPLTSGRFVIAWGEGVSSSGGNSWVYQAVYNSNGTIWKTPLPVSNGRPGIYVPPYMAEVGSSGWVVSWGETLTSVNGTDSPQVMQRRYTSTAVGQPEQVVDQGVGYTYPGMDKFQIASRSGGGWSIAWRDLQTVTAILRQSYTSSGASDGSASTIFQGTSIGDRGGIRPARKNFNYDSAGNFLSVDYADALYISFPGVPQGIDIGLRVKESGGIVAIAAEVATALTSPIRIAKAGVIYSLLLIDPTHECASAAKIKTSSGIMSLQKHGCGG